MGFVKDTFRSFTGQAGADAAEGAADTQAAAGQAAIRQQKKAAGKARVFFEPFEGIAERGVEASSFLADPQEQFDFLQSNPLFKLALENANQQTLQGASANKRLSFGDTLQDLSNNVLLSASPLIDRQRQDATNLLNFGVNVAGSRANIETGLGTNVSNLTTDIGAAIAGGQVGAANARAQGTQNIVNAGLTAAFASDVRLKTDIELKGNHNGHNWYTWSWNELAGKALGLFGAAEGVIAQEVLNINPDAVIFEDGFYKVKYGEL